MFNFGTGIENVTQLKKGPCFIMVLLSVGQHLSLWPAIKTLSPDLGNYSPNYTKFSDHVNHLFLRSLSFDTSRAFIVTMLK